MRSGAKQTAWRTRVSAWVTLRQAADLLAVTPASYAKGLNKCREYLYRLPVNPEPGQKLSRGAVSRLRGARREKLGREGQPRTMVFHRCLRAESMPSWCGADPHRFNRGPRNGFEQPDTVRAISHGRRGAGCSAASVQPRFVRADVSLPAFRGYIPERGLTAFGPRLPGSNAPMCAVCADRGGYHRVMPSGCVSRCGHH